MGAAAVVALAVLGALAANYTFWGGHHRSLDGSGFNMARLSSTNADAGIPAPGAAPATPFSVRGPTIPLLPPPAPMTAGRGPFGGNPGMASPPANPAAPAGSQARSFTQAVVQRRLLYRGIRDKYIAQSPVVRQYFQDWQDAPDLAQLKAEYGQDHDVIKFAWGAAKSPQFAALIQRYIAQPDFRAYMLETAMSSPKDVLDAWNQFAAKDSTAKQLAADFLHSSGLPVSLAEALANGKMDPQQAASQVAAEIPKLPGGPGLEQARQGSGGI